MSVQFITMNEDNDTLTNEHALCTRRDSVYAALSYNATAFECNANREFDRSLFTLARKFLTLPPYWYAVPYVVSLGRTLDAMGQE